MRHMTTVATFEIGYTQFLDPRGEPTQPLPPFASEPAALIALYRAMVLARTFDAKAIALQRTGKIGTFASALGQEAVGVGSRARCARRHPGPSYRDHRAQFLRGVTMVESLLYWGGDERGSAFAGPRHDFQLRADWNQVCQRWARHTRSAAARAARYRVLAGRRRDSRGDFYEGLNMAGVWQVPLVLIVNNNQWAISVPRSLQSAAKTLAQKAIAAGIDGLQIDGNDIIAVRHATGEALAKARAGGGPTLIEALTYRLGDHTTADDATRYRDAETVRQQWQFEPILRLRNCLARSGAWDKDKEEALQRECAEQVNQAVDDFLAIAPPDPDAMFDCLYATLPAALEEQRAAARRFAPRGGEARG
jgi:pyruvate dehydrogenase E1 component alpha subunit